MRKVVEAETGSQIQLSTKKHTKTFVSDLTLSLTLEPMRKVVEKTCKNFQGYGETSWNAEPVRKVVDAETSLQIQH